MTQTKKHFIQSFAEFIPTLYKLLRLGNEMTCLAITVIASLSAFKELVPVLAQYSLGDYFRSLLTIDQYKEDAKTYLTNMGLY